MNKYKHVNSFTNIFINANTCVPYLVSAHQYFSKKISFGYIAIIGASFSQLQGALTFFISSYSNLANLAAVIQRLFDFAKSIEKIEKFESKIEIEDANDLEISNLNVSLPSGREILNNFSTKFKYSKSILIVVHQAVENLHYCEH